VLTLEPREVVLLETILRKATCKPFKKLTSEEFDFALHVIEDSELNELNGN
jgi:hypothetical protein